MLCTLSYTLFEGQLGWSTTDVRRPNNRYFSEVVWSVGCSLFAATALPRVLVSWVTPNRMLLEVLLGLHRIECYSRYLVSRGCTEQNATQGVSWLHRIECYSRRFVATPNRMLLKVFRGHTEQNATRGVYFLFEPPSILEVVQG